MLFCRLRPSCHSIVFSVGSEAHVAGLFDDRFENVMEGKAFRRSWYSSLTSSIKPEIITIRQLLETWFQEFPDVADKFDLVGRFQSDNDDQHLAAFFELYCFTLLRSQGFEVEVHQRIDPKRGTQPDFLAKRDNVPLFYLECTTVTDRPEETGEQKRLHDVLDYQPVGVPGLPYRRKGR